jgi:hypothetical protein
VSAVRTDHQSTEKDLEAFAYYPSRIRRTLAAVNRRPDPNGAIPIKIYLLDRKTSIIFLSHLAIAFGNGLKYKKVEGGSKFGLAPNLGGNT